jgi:aspartate 1-decarboxylase
MFLKVLRAKIHRATVTQAEVDYVGSITIDRDIMDAVGLLSGESVLVADLADGARFETYALEGPRGSGIICVNGAAARLVRVGDKVIIMAFAYAEPAEAEALKPRIALMGDDNRIVGTK